MSTQEASVVWDESLQILHNREETKSLLAQAYLNYLVPTLLDEKQMVFSVRLSHAKQHIEERYVSYINEALAAVLGEPRQVVFVLDDTASSYTPATASFAPTQLSQASPLSQSAQQPSSSPLSARAQVLSTQAQPLSVQTPVPAPIQTQAPLHPQAHVPQAQAQPLQPAATSQLVPQPTPQPASQLAAQSTPQLASQQASPASFPSGFYEGDVKTTGISSYFAQEGGAVAASENVLGTRFTFANYVEGDSNRYACSVSMRVAESPGKYFNPLFIYGKSGLGKTHLLLSIKHYLTSYLPDKRVVYVPTTEFVDDFTNAFRPGGQDLSHFKRKYHTCDVLLIDDVQILEGKEGSTDALFEIFNLFIESNKQIVLSADRSPVELNLDERYTSRFLMGITADIQPPNFEMKTAILKNYKRYYCQFQGIPELAFADDAIQKIVELSGSNVRELEGALNSIISSFLSKSENLEQARVTLSDVERVLGKSFFHKTSRRINAGTVVQAVQSYFKVAHVDLISEKRSKGISHPRQVAMYLIRRYTDMSYPEIGALFKKDHATAIYADRQIEKKVAKDIAVRIEVEKLAEMLAVI